MYHHSHSLSHPVAKTVFRLFIFIGLLSLTACLVHPSDAKKKTYNRTTDSVHIYKAGDSIEYSVYGQASVGFGSVSSITGTMKITWYANDNIIDPVSSTSYEVLKEVTILNINGVETRSERYISQDTDGTIKLHAFYKPASADLYWVSDAGITPPTALNEVIILKSPLMLNDSYASTFYVFNDCNDTNLCSTSLGYQSDDAIKVEGTNETIEIQAGFFNTIRVTYSGNKILTSGVTSFPIHLDSRSSCGSGNTSYYGLANYMPEVGIIKMDVHCTAATAIYTYTIEFKRAGGSIALP